MNVSLTEHFEDFVARQVKSGRYNNASEVIRASLRLLESEEQERETKLEALRGAIREGLESGEPVPAEQVFDRIGKRQQKRKAGRP